MSRSLENWETSQKLHLVVCVIVRKLASFFQKMRFHFSKARKKYKKIKKTFFLLKMYKLVPKLWYMFSEDILIFYFSPPKIIFYVFQSNLKKSTGLRWRWRWRWRWKIFHWEMLRKFSGQLPTYIGGPEKNLGTIPNVKFFTADPYFGVVFSTGLRKSAQNSTFLRF